LLPRAPEAARVHAPSATVGVAFQYWLGSMNLEQGAALVALTWLIGALLLMARSIRRGRELAAGLESRDPDTYEALGRPRPGFLYSPRRDRFSQFVARREYESLSDPVLAAKFEAYRRHEARLVVCLLASMGVVFLMVMVVRYAA